MFDFSLINFNNSLFDFNFFEPLKSDLINNHNYYSNSNLSNNSSTSSNSNSSSNSNLINNFNSSLSSILNSSLSSSLNSNLNSNSNKYIDKNDNTFNNYSNKFLERFSKTFEYNNLKLNNISGINSSFASVSNSSSSSNSSNKNKVSSRKYNYSLSSFYSDLVNASSISSGLNSNSYSNLNSSLSTSSKLLGINNFIKNNKFKKDLLTQLENYYSTIQTNFVESSLGFNRGAVTKLIHAPSIVNARKNHDISYNNLNRSFDYFNDSSYQKSNNFNSINSQKIAQAYSSMNKYFDSVSNENLSVLRNYSSNVTNITPQINVSLVNHNTINTVADFDNIIDELVDNVTQALSVCAEGVHF